MNVNPKSCITGSKANISQNKTIELLYRENGKTDTWYPWSAVPDKVLYAWKNGSNIIYTLTDELTTGPIDIFTNGTVLTRTTAEAVKAGDVEMDAWYLNDPQTDPAYNKSTYFDATKVASWGGTPVFDTISKDTTGGFQEVSKTLIWTDGDYNNYSRSHLSRPGVQTYSGREIAYFALNTAYDDSGYIETISKTGVTVKINYGSGHTSGLGYQIYYTPLVSIDHIKYDSKTWLRNEVADITIGD
jgi:hypothetical protein